MALPYQLVSLRCGDTLRPFGSAFPRDLDYRLPITSILGIDLHRKHTVDPRIARRITEPIHISYAQKRWRLG